MRNERHGKAPLQNVHGMPEAGLRSDGLGMRGIHFYDKRVDQVSDWSSANFPDARI
jgi:hypothetical protein